MAVKLGEYVLTKPIGRGAMGQVWLAMQESLDRPVAVKVLPKELARNQSFRARFEREAKAAASLIHPNVIQMYSFGIEQDVPYFAMEYVEGEDLAVKLRKGQRFSVREAVRIVADVAKALECADEKKIVHRDIKPGNIMIAKNGVVKVMDFGLAKATSVQSAITQPGTVMGTPSYMSPEQGKGEELDVRSDMYSLGIVLYKLLTGTVPFKADKPTAVIFLHIYENPKPVREVNPEIPEVLEGIVSRLLEKEPGARYPSPTALIEDLEAFLSGATTSMAAPAAGSDQPALRTEALDAQSSQAFAVTEPILERGGDPASLPTMPAPAPKTFIKTGEEELEFLEDLLQGGDPAAYKRAPELFEEAEGLRDGYARQQFMHALLRSRVDMRDRVSRGRRLTRLLSVMGREKRPAAPVTAPRYTPGPMPRAKGPLLYYGIFLAVIVVAAAAGLIMLMPGTLPKAEALVEMARDKLSENRDWRYSVTVSVYVQGIPQDMTGTMHVRGADKSLTELRTQYGTVFLGSDGEASWILPPSGYVYMYEDRKHLRRTIPEAVGLPLMTMDELLARRGEFVMRLIGVAKLPGHEKRKLIEVHCSAIRSRTESELNKAKYWIDKESGIVVKADLNLLQGPMDAGHRQVIMEYEMDEHHDEDFYKCEKHNLRNLPLFRPDVHKGGPGDERPGGFTPR